MLVKGKWEAGRQEGMYESKVGFQGMWVEMVDGPRSQQEDPAARAIGIISCDIVRS